MTKTDSMRCPSLAELPPPPFGRVGWPWTEETAALAPGTNEGTPWPRISIVTPSYNQAQFLEETIRSVLLQGYPDLEYIIMDGGSTDNSVEIIKKYAKWINYWVSRPDGGQPDAINNGLLICTGVLMTFINSDDILARSALSKVAEVWRSAGSPSVALFTGQVQNIFVNDPARNWLFTEARRGGVQDWICGRMPFAQQGSIWTRAAWERCGPLPAGYQFIFDKYFFAKIVFDRKCRFVVLNSLLASFRFHVDSKSVADNAAFGIEWSQAVDKLIAELPRAVRLSSSWVLWRHRNMEFAARLFEQNDRFAARTRLISHLLHDPGSIMLRPIFGAARRLLLRRADRRE